jgi:hypothetical protein
MNGKYGDGGKFTNAQQNPAFAVTGRDRIPLMEIFLRAEKGRE